MDYRKKCPLCNSKKYKVIEFKNLSNEKLYNFIKSNYNIEKYLSDKNYSYELRYCLFCGTRYQTNVLDENESRELYSKSIQPQKSFFKQIFNYKKNLIVRKKTAKFLKKLFESRDEKIHKALEIGAGWGFFAHLSKEFKFEFTTLEISEERRKFHDFLKLKNINDFNDALKKRKQYDLIYSNQVLEHISDINLFVKNCNNLLKVNGYFVAEFPSYNHYLHYFSNKKNFYNDKRTKALEHLQLISDKGIMQLIKNNASFEYCEQLPLRRYGDRLRYFLQNLTPLKLRGKGFVVAKKIK